MADQALCLLARFEDLQGISATFDSWLAIAQSALAGALRNGLDHIMASAGADAQAAIGAAELALRIEPSNAVALRFLMRHHWRARAIALYDAAYCHLDAVFDHEPAPETMSLVAAIKLDPDGGAAQPSAPLPPPRPRIAVALGPDSPPPSAPPGMAAVPGADLRRRLCRFREWQVVDDAGDGDVVLRARLLAMGAQPVLSVELVRPGTGRLLWAEMIESPDEGWGDKLRRLLIHLAAALSVAISARAWRPRRRRL